MRKRRRSSSSRRTSPLADATFRARKRSPESLLCARSQVDADQTFCTHKPCPDHIGIHLYIVRRGGTTTTVLLRPYVQKHAYTERSKMSDSETNGRSSGTEPGDPEAFGRPSCIRARLSHTRTCGATSPQGPVEFVAHGGRRNAQYTGERRMPILKFEPFDRLARIS